MARREEELAWTEEELALLGLRAMARGERRKKLRKNRGGEERRGGEEEGSVRLFELKQSKE